MRDRNAKKEVGFKDYLAVIVTLLVLTVSAVYVSTLTTDTAYPNLEFYARYMDKSVSGMVGENVVVFGTVEEALTLLANSHLNSDDAPVELADENINSSLGLLQREDVASGLSGSN